MVRPKTKLVALALLMLVVGFLMSCDAGTFVRGVVRDTNHHPIAGASIRLILIKSGRMEEHYSDETGSFEVAMLHGFFPGGLRLVVSKTGYSGYTRNITAKTRQEIDVVLTLNPKPVNQIADAYPHVHRFPRTS